MPNDTVDTLNIEISSITTKANKALDSLAKKLLSVNKALQSVNTGGLRNYARDMGKVSASIKALNGIKINIPNFGGLDKQLEKLSKIDFSKLSDSEKPLKNLASGLKSLDGLQNISVPKLEAKNINSIVNAVGKLQNVDANKIPAVSQGLETVTKSMLQLNTVKTKETGINNTIGSLKRLLEVDMSSFNTSAFKDISNTISSFGNMEDISPGVNRFIASLQKLINAGDKAGQVTLELPKLGNALSKVIKDLSGIKDVSDSVNLFVQSIGRLASAGAKTQQTAGQLRTLAEETLAFFNVMKDAPHISENTIRMTEALAQLASAGGRVGTATSSITGAFDKLSKTSSEAANMIKKVMSTIASATVGTFKKITQISISAASAIKNMAIKISSSFSMITKSGKGLNSVVLNLGNLLKTAVLFKGAQGLMNFSKTAIGLGSDITEVENVVDTAFGSMASKAYNFASTASKQFGLSELAAKQYSGTMMAMLKSSGIAQDAASDMSTTLAGLAGDIASFYNIDTDVAFEKLRAGIGGETEPLKQLGINMNVVNLEAFAMSKGINKSYNEMTLAEQTMLRYSYILAKTGDAQGDFNRTVDSFANQWRLLKLNIQSVSAVIGQGLIAAILPAIKALNKLMEKLMDVAEAFRNFVYTLTGKKLEGSQKGIADMASSGYDASDALGDMADSAKDLEKSLSVLSFDELNQLVKPDEDDKKLSDDIGDFGDALGKNDADSQVNDWAQRIRDAFLNHDWEKLGEEIAKLLNKGLQKIYDVINWKNVGPKITAFVDGFTRTFNSLVDNLDWDLLGRTIGAGVNTIVNTLNLLIEGINWKNLGKKFSEGFRGMIREIEWRNLGNLLGNYFMIAWNILDGFITDMSSKSDAGLTGWAELGNALGEAVNGIFDKVDFTTMANVLVGGFNGVFETLRNFTLTVEWDDIAENITNGLTTMIRGIKWAEAGTSLGMFVTDLFGTFQKIAEETPWVELGEGIGDFLISIPWGTIFENVFNIITDILGGLITGLGGKIISKFDTIGTALADGFNLAFDKLKEFTLSIQWDDIAVNIYTGLNNMIHGIDWADAGSTLSDFVVNLLGVFEDVAENTDWEGLGEGIGTFLSNIDWLTIFQKVFTIISDVLGGLVSGLASTTAGKLGIALVTAIGGIKLVGAGLPIANSLSKELTGTSVTTKIITAITDAFKPATDLFTSGGAIYETLGAGATNLSIAFEGLTGISIPVGASMAGIVAAVVAAVAGIVLAVKDLWDTSESFRDAVTNAFEKVKESLTNAFEKVKDAIEPLWESIKDLGDSLYNFYESSGIKSIVALFATWATTIGGSILSTAIDAISTAFAGFLKILTGAVEIISGVLDVLSGIFSLDFDKAVEGFKSVGQGIVDAFSGLAEILFGVAGDIISGLLEGIADAFSDMGGWLKEHILDPFINKFKDLFGIHSPSTVMAEQGKYIIEGLLEGLKNTIDSVLDWIAKIPGWIREKLGDAKNWLVGKGKDVITGLKNGLTSNWNSVTSWLKEIPQKIKSAIPNLFNIGKEIIQNFINGFKSLHIPTPHFQQTGTMSIAGIDTPIPTFGVEWYKTGGLFDSPSVIGVGEAGREVVLPLENQRTMSMVADSIMSKASSSMDEETLTNAVARGVAMAMMNNQQNPINVTCYAELKTENDEVLARAVTRGQEKIDYRMNPTPQFGY